MHSYLVYLTLKIIFCILYTLLQLENPTNGAKSDQCVNPSNSNWAPSIPLLCFWGRKSLSTILKDPNRYVIVLIVFMETLLVQSDVDMHRVLAHTLIL